MIEALISLRPNGETDLKKRGDVICVKPSGAIWSDAEKSFHTVIEIDNQDLENQLKAMEDKGIDHPLIVHPFAAYGDENELISRSTKFLDVNAQNNKTDLLDKTKFVEKFSATLKNR